MSPADVVRLPFVLCCLMPRASAAQVPAELQEAMRARDEAIAKADADTWDRFTTADFTDVRTDGTLMTRAARLALLKTQTPTTPVPRKQVQIKHYDDVYVRRSRTVDAWVLDIWVKDAGVWRVVAAQLTTAKE
jgi:hypothetical protein